MADILPTALPIEIFCKESFVIKFKYTEGYSLGS